MNLEHFASIASHDPLSTPGQGSTFIAELQAKIVMSA